MKEIALGETGSFAIVDDDDYEFLSNYRWTRDFSGSGKVTYARGVVDGRSVFMHRLIMGDTGGAEVDHINRNGLDNRRKNLRLVTHQQNLVNRGAQKNHTTSKYKGVSRNHNGFDAKIRVDRNLIYLGYFSSEVEAARAYDTAARKYFGEYAYINGV